MARRDRDHRGYDTAYLVGPVSPAVVEALPRALQRLVDADHMGYAGRRWPAHGPAAEPEVLRLPDDLDDLALILRVREAGYRGVPLAVGTAGDRVAVLVPHELADGTESVALLQGLLTVAAGGDLPVVEAAVRFPVLRAMRSVRPASVRALRRHRRAEAPLEVAMTPPAAPAFTTVTLTGERLAAVKRGRSAGGRATISTRLASIAIAALLATAHDDSAGVLLVPFDLRHTAGGRVRGNFVHAEVLGLLGDDWTPGRLSAALAARREILLPAMLSGLLRPRLPRRRRAASSLQPRGALVSMMTMPRLPAALWAQGDTERRFACVSISANADLLVVVATAPDTATVSVLDASGWIDVERFPAALQAEIDARLAAAA